MGRFDQALIEGDEWNRLTQLTLQVKTARKLNGIVRAQRTPQEQRARIGCDLRDHLDHRKGGQVRHEGRQRAVATLRSERTLPSPANDAG
jgi:hypothetical protein